MGWGPRALSELDGVGQRSMLKLLGKLTARIGMNDFPTVTLADGPLNPSIPHLRNGLL